MRDTHLSVRINGIVYTAYRTPWWRRALGYAPWWYWGHSDDLFSLQRRFLTQNEYIRMRFRTHLPGTFIS